MKKAFMHPWGTISNNRHTLESTCKLGLHDWKITEVKAKKESIGNGEPNRFRLVTRTCSKCGYTEQTAIQRKS